MPHNIEPTPPSRYWLITSPRTASNMLVKILNLDAQGVRPSHRGGYFFMSAVLRRMSLLTQPMTSWPDEERALVDEEHQQAFDKFQDYISAAEETGQLVFVKEHAIMMSSPFFESQHVHGPDSVTGEPRLLAQRGVESPTRSSLNLTWMPDEFLKTWKPTFLIRHPALMLPSLFRTCLNETEAEGFRRPTNEPTPIETTMKWFRTLYDFYTAHFGEDSQWPIVLDADDIMMHPELVLKYAQLIGLDPNKVRFSWDKVSDDKLKSLSFREQRMLDTINASSKVDTSKVAGSLDISKEAAKWRNEFGDEGGLKLEQWVRDAMPHYTFMHSKRLRLDS